MQSGEIVDNKRLAAVLTQIRGAQQDRDRQRLANPKRTLRQKSRIQTALKQAQPVVPV